MQRFLKTISGKSLLFAAMLAMSMASPTLYASDLVVRNAKIFLPKDDTISMVGTATLKNVSSEELIVIKIRSSSYKLSMIHQTADDSGVKRMMLKSDLIIKPGAEIKMSPDGVHFRFAGGRQKLKSGSKVTVDLHLNNGEKMPVRFLLVK